MAEFTRGNAADLKNNTAQYAEGSYVSAEKILVVRTQETKATRRGARVSVSGQSVTVRTVTAFTRGQSDGKVNSATTIIYALDPKADKWQPVGISRDGLNTIHLKDPEGAYPLVGGEDAQNVPFYDNLSEGLLDSERRGTEQVRKNLEDTILESTANADGGASFDEAVMRDATTAERQKLLAAYRNAQEQEPENDPSRPVNPGDAKGKVTDQVFESPVFSSQGLSYPIDLDLDVQDALKITIHKRLPRKFEGGRRDPRFDRGAGEDGKIKSLATIYLPITGNIRDSNNVDYNDNSLNFLQGFAIQTLSDAIKDDGGELGMVSKSISQAMQIAGENKIPVRNLIGDFTAATALKGLSGQSVNNIQSRFSGQILNPNMELLFNGPKLRNFDFQFKLTPRERDESIRIQQIITAIKRHMAPKRGKNGGFFLGAPDFFRLQYLYRNSQHRFLNRFKDCALIGFDINYAPEGTYATYPDGGMHSYLMTMRFAELDPIYFEDYEDNDIANKRAGVDPSTPGAGGIGF